MFIKLHCKQDFFLNKEHFFIVVTTQKSYNTYNRNINYNTSTYILH